MIIDARCRPPINEFQSQFRTSRMMARIPAFPVPDPPSYTNDSMELFFQEMEEAGITTAVVVGRNRPRFEVPNDAIADLVANYPGKFVGVAGIDCYNESHQAIAEIERSAVQLKLKGICIEPGGNKRRMYNNDRRLYPIYAKCDELKLPVFITTGPKVGESIEHTRPIYIEQVAQDFPELKIVCAHGCWPYIMETIGVASRCPNIFILPDTYTFRPSGELYVQATDRYLENQFLFGTAYPLARLKESIEALKKFPMRREVQNKILYENASRLFGL